MMVWSAGLAPVKFLTENNNFEKGMMGRIKVGDVVRVPGSLGSSRIISGDLG
jgi:NADH dehydrogenase FAD-containing subunit